MTLFSFSQLVLPQCTDSNHDQYSLIASNNVPTPAECAQFCHKLPSPYLVGFLFEFRDDQCFCLYSGQNVPTPPSGIGSLSIYTGGIGTGPISDDDTEGSSGDCYAFAQVRGVFVTTLVVSEFITHHSLFIIMSCYQGTAAPTTSTPSTAALSYTLVGNGLVRFVFNSLS